MSELTTFVLRAVLADKSQPDTVLAARVTGWHGDLYVPILISGTRGNLGRRLSFVVANRCFMIEPSRERVATVLDGDRDAEPPALTGHYVVHLQPFIFDSEEDRERFVDGLYRFGFSPHVEEFPS